MKINAVMWRFRTGSPWRDVPAEYGPWSTVYDRFRSWAKTGIFQHLPEAVIAEAAARGQADLELVSVDSTTARTHHHAAGMALNPDLLDALEKVVDEEKGLRTRGTHLPMADQAANRKKCGSRGGRPVSHDPDLYKERNTAERCINRIKEWRGLAFRFDKTPESYLAGLHLRGAILWIRSLRPA
ncbi:transposase [Streptosporangium sp. NPDC087985]|uniref:transposase n=1 Tax=Streptosporangium sp. NPDC087985 TaxID=3366196 RepID=UPI0038295A29